MKKVKFTLGLMLAMLFIGANVSYAVDYQPEKTNAKNGYKYKTAATGGDARMGSFVIPIGIDVSPSSFYANKTPFSGNNAIEAGLYAWNTTNTIDQSGNIIAGKDLRFEGGSYDNLTGSFYSYDGMLYLLREDYRMVEWATVKLNFKEGNDNKVFLKRSIILGKMAYNPETEQNEWIPSGLVVQDLIDPILVTDKTEFTDEDGVATYKFQHNFLELFVKYPIYSMYYEIWVNNEINTPYDKNFGEGHAYPLTNKNLNIEAAEGITVSYNAWDYFVSGKNFSFDVYAEPGKELEFTTNSEKWNVANGGLKAVYKGAGVWTVTLTQITAKISIKIGYAVESESATGNGSYATDKVWGANGTLNIQSAGEGVLSVYSITGQLVKSIVVNGDYSTSLAKGMYIIKLNNKAYKVAL